MKEKNTFLSFIVGIAMFASGLYWFTSSVKVITGFYPIRLGGISMSGLVVVPLICGIIWLFTDLKSKGPKILTGAGLIIIFASIIAQTRFIFRSTSLYSYLIMLIFIFGGAALILQYIFQSQGKNR